MPKKKKVSSKASSVKKRNSLVKKTFPSLWIGQGNLYEPQDPNIRKKG